MICGHNPEPLEVLKPQGVVFTIRCIWLASSAPGWRRAAGLLGILGLRELSEVKPVGGFGTYGIDRGKIIFDFGGCWKKALYVTLYLCYTFAHRWDK